MVKYIDILKAINKLLEDNFSNVPILSEKDVEEKIIRPSFMVSMDNISSNNFMNAVIDKSVTIRIYYFPSNKYKYKIENLNMIDNLNELFVENDILKLENFNILINGEISTDVVQSVLNYNFDIEFSENIIRDYSGIENMEDLETNID